MRAEVKFANAPPALALALAVDGIAWGRGPVRVLPGASGLLGAALAAVDPNGDPLTMSTSLVDWDGHVVATESGESPTFELATLRAGRYTIAATARDPADAAARATAVVEVGAWLEGGLASDVVALALANGSLEGEARLVVTGNVPVGAIVVRLEPLAGPATLSPSGVRITLRLGGLESATVTDAAGEARFAVLVDPGADVRMRVAWPLPPDTPTGAYVGGVSVALEAAS